MQGENLIFYRSSSAKGKDLFGLYLHQIILQYWQTQADHSAGDLSAEDKALLLGVDNTKGFYFDTKNQQPTQYRYCKIANASTHLAFILETYLQGQQQALLLNTELAEKYFREAIKKLCGKSILGSSLIVNQVDETGFFGSSFFHRFGMLFGMFFRMFFVVFFVMFFRHTAFFSVFPYHLYIK